MIIVLCQQVLSQPALLTPLSSAYAAGDEDIRGIGINQASLAYISESQLALGTSRSFMMNELVNYSLAIGLKSRFGNFGLSADYFGSTRYNQSQLGLAYGMKLTDNIAIGSRFNYHGLKLAGYGQSAIFGAEAGLLIKLQEKFAAGIHFSNPFAPGYGKDGGQRLPFACRLGGGYSISSTCFIAAEMIKEENQPLDGRFVIEYKFVSFCRARFGINTAYSNIWTSVGLNWQQSIIDISVAYHPQLGISPGLLLLYKLKSRKE